MARTELGDIYAYMQQTSKVKRGRNRARCLERLIKENINFENKNDRIHIIISEKGLTIDYWPGTGRYKVRNGKTGFGIKNLLKLIK